MPSRSAVSSSFAPRSVCLTSKSAGPSMRQWLSPAEATLVDEVTGPVLPTEMHASNRRRRREGQQEDADQEQIEVIMKLPESNNNDNDNKTVTSSVDAKAIAHKNNSPNAPKNNNNNDNKNSDVIIEDARLLEGKEDAYGGIILSADKLPSSASDFADRLLYSIGEWKKKARRGIWLKVPHNQSDLVPIAKANGFHYHHAVKDYIMLTLWLPSTPSTLPSYAFHSIGVAGFVVNEKNEVLVVQERKGLAVGLWKLPGGAVDAGEDLHVAALREVFEETGIKAEVKQLLCFCHSHGLNFQQDDLYFVFLMSPKTLEIHPQESEIADCKWMPFAELDSLPYYPTGSLFRQIMDTGKAAFTESYEGISFKSYPVRFRNRPPSYLYTAATTASTPSKL